MAREFGVRGSISSLMDRSAQLGLCAAILALKDAGIPLVQHYKRTTTGGSIPTTWGLPVPLQEETGIIMATAFPGLESFIEEISRYFAYKYAAKPWKTLWGIYDKMISLIEDVEERKRLADWFARQRALLPAGG